MSRQLISYDILSFGMLPAGPTEFPVVVTIPGDDIPLTKRRWAEDWIKRLQIGV